MDEVEVESTLLADGSSSRLKRIGSLRKQPYFTNLRFQLQEQLKSFDTRLDTQVLLTNELQDFFRKKAEIELEYSRSLDKLTKTLVLRHKELRQRREQVHLFSLYNCWQELISQTRKQSQEHAVLADIYNTHVTSRLNFVTEDLQRVYKQCHEIGTDSHEELLKVLHELHTSTKTFHLYQTEHRQTESKLKLVETQKKKMELIIPKEKIEKSKKLRLVEKEMQKRRNKYTDARFKALKAKNEYVLCMDAANAAVQKYFVDDLSDLIDCMDLGFYQCISRALNMFISSQDHVRSSIGTNMSNLSKCILGLDSRLDKQKFLEANNSVFVMPKKVEFQTLKGEELDSTENGAELETAGFIRPELEQRLIQLHRRLDTLRIEADESWKTLETAESSLVQLLSVNDYSTDDHFLESSHSRTSANSKTDYVLTSQRLRAETDEFHLSKFRDYMLGTNRIARLQAKYDHIRKVLGDLDPTNLSPGLAQTLAEPRKVIRRKRIGHFQSSRNPRLFGGSLEEYIEFTNQEIPVVLKSCIRVINLYGLHHQGIFRVSGSQIEINNFKDAFERGEDPLIDINDASDINSIAGVLKLYLRELREPLFPIVYFEQFMELAQLESKNLFVMKLRDLIGSLPRPVYIVLRYLFAFLNHLSEYSDENMMDPYNIAICFGPTLVPVPEDKDQVQYQNLVNELIKNVIVYMEDIFVGDEDLGGVRYEKYISKEPDEVDVDTPGDDSQDDLTSDLLCPSEDDSVFLKDRDISLHVFEKSDYLEGIAQYDFKARSDREISFRKGDSITLYSQVSNDWWKGSCNGVNGLVPDKYIMLKIKDEEHRERLMSSPFLFEKKPSLGHHHSRTASDSFLTTRSLPATVPTMVLKLHTTNTSDTVTTPVDSSAGTEPTPSRSSRSSTSETPNGDRIFKIEPLILSCTETVPKPEPVPNTVAITQSQLDLSIESKITDDDLTEGSISITTSEPKSIENEAGGQPGGGSEVVQVSPSNGHGQMVPSKMSTPGVTTATGGNVVKPKVFNNITFWEAKAKFSSPATPDLVMDLPMINTGNRVVDEEQADTSPDSVETAAECFAKQNQNTLKKNYKNPLKKDIVEESVGQLGPQQQQPSTSSTNNSKPQVKVKPIVLKKPTVPIHLLYQSGGNHGNPKANYDEEESSKPFSDDEKTTNL